MVSKQALLLNQHSATRIIISSPVFRLPLVAGEGLRLSSSSELFINPPPCSSSSSESGTTDEGVIPPLVEDRADLAGVGSCCCFGMVVLTTVELMWTLIKDFATRPRDKDY
jgi:hypothetical protein